MKDMFLGLCIKVKDQKGEVSVEWALVAVVMCLIILGAFLPGVKDGLNTAFTNIKANLGTNSLP
jgi:Flp pilus assembly pilin Flp